MSCVERSAFLADLFAAAIVRHCGDAEIGGGAAHPPYSLTTTTAAAAGGASDGEIYSVVGPFLAALSAAQREVSHFDQRAENAIASALWTMDECVTGTLMDLEADLSETTAGFVTLGATLDRLETKIDEALQLVVTAQENARKADALCEADAGGESSETAMSSGWVDRVVKRIADYGNAAERYLVGPSGEKKFSSSAPRCRDALDHCKCAVDILRAVVVGKKMRLGLCEEELRLFRKDILLLGKCHVVSGAVDGPVEVPSLFTDDGPCQSVPADDTVKRQQEGEHGDIDAAPRVDDNNSGALRNDASHHEDPSSQGPTTSSSSRVLGLRDRARQSLQRVLKTTASATSRNALAAQPRSVAAALAGVVNSSLSNHATVDSDMYLNRPAAEQHQYWSRFAVPDEDKPKMEAELVLLEQQLTESSARAAREIEGAVRELSQLTSLLNEKAVVQAEQLSAVLKNTDDAHTNVQKAASQLQRASQAGFWNASRQLIALLWACTAFVLVAHVVIR